MNEKIEEGKGKIKETVGKITDNERLEAKGKIEQKGAQAKEYIKDRADDTRQKATDSAEKTMNNLRRIH